MSGPVPVSANSLTIDVLPALDDVAGLSASWNRLADGIPFRSWEWQAGWWRSYGATHRLFVMTAQDDERYVGIAPFYVEHASPVGGVLRFLGSGEVCSDQQGLLVEAGYESAVAEALADFLAIQVNSHSASSSMPANRRSRTLPNWSLIELEGMSATSPANDRFLARLKENDFHNHCSAPVNTWRLPLPPNIDAYTASLSKSSRRKVRAALKQLATPNCRVTFTETEEDFERLWSVLVQLHQRRRNSLGDAGCFDRRTHAQFLYETAREWARTGLLDLACVSLDDRPIAAELCFRGDSTTFAYQIGIDPDYLHENPGWLVNTASIQRAIALGQSWYDLCRGDEEYKHHMGARPQPCGSCRIVPPRLRSQLWDVALLTQTTVKDWLKTGLFLTGMR